MNDKAKREDGVTIAIPKTTVLRSADPEVFACFVDRAKYTLKMNFDKVNKRADWQAPAGILLSLLLTGTTSNFKKTFGASADFWSAVAFCVGLVSIVWLVVGLYRAYIAKNITPESIVEELRSGQGND